VSDEAPAAGGWRRALRLVADVRRGEWTLALSFAGYFFLVITTFWILKPLRTSQFLGVLGAKHLPWARLVTATLVLPLGALLAWLSAHVPRRGLLLGVAGTFGVGHLAFWLLDPLVPPFWVHVPFYFWVDLFVTANVALFWSFLNEHVTAESAKRLFGIIGAGGMLGGILGSTLAGFLAPAFGGRQLLLLTMVPTTATFLLILWLDRRLRRAPLAPPAPTDAPAPRATGAAWDGLAMVARSPYLLGILAIVTAYEVSSVIADYQFSALVAAEFPGRALGDARTAFLGKFSLATGLVGLAIQLLATSAIQRRLGLGAALAVLPLALLLGAGVFVALPGLVGAALWFGADATLNYGIHQTSKEALYAPTPLAVKYRAKAFIDIFGVRLAKALGAAVVWLLLLVELPARWQAVAAAVVAVLWLAAVRFTARRFAQQAPPP
jgi:AAA family ATP:ADP antiporter